jgi:DNA helicase-2/ATP-dependent DNA helicase PcrA
MIDLTPTQQRIVEATGHLLVTGGPGSGKTTISILKAGRVARDTLPPQSRVLFLSFARATVSRVLEAIEEERQVSPEEKRRIEVDTYHSFF